MRWVHGNILPGARCKQLGVKAVITLGTGGWGLIILFHMTLDPLTQCIPASIAPKRNVSAARVRAPMR
ncbi:hypothetical protein BV22DRAFT_1027615 [Leucogyrophana mollusca]|uniref:Uncharacterized protein n=1 Tax=Leucogyrophana mollusca TaxID=85980 RepID=A0ACB8C097_9AGAM|nr:hypothetical protein BV22DRAFT_1027615 [Leucogyrophana mollusca]